MTFIVQSIKIRKSPAVLFVVLMNERDFHEFATSFRIWEVGWWHNRMPWLILMNWLYCQAIVTAMSES